MIVASDYELYDLDQRLGRYPGLRICHVGYLPFHKPITVADMFMTTAKPQTADKIEGCYGQAPRYPR
jgi:hypothetical protein